jgi:hypothetical protein
VSALTSIRAPFSDKEKKMKRVRVIWSLALAASTSFGLLQAQMPAGPNRPASIPDGYLITPFGYVHASCVYRLSEGDWLLSDGLVIEHKGGAQTNIPACGYPRYTAAGEIVADGANPRFEPPTIVHSWIEDSDTSTTTSYGELTAQWDVPLSPPSNNSQTVYFFPGFEDYSYGTRIIQPVLGWNADFAGAWGIASWNYISGNAMESSPKGATPGDIIAGYLQATCSAGTQDCQTWNITTTDAVAEETTALSSSTAGGQNFNWAFGGVLEVYSISQCSDYPATTSLTFSYVSLYDYNFNLISNPGWVGQNLSSGLTPQCNYSVSAGTTQTTVNYGTTRSQAVTPTLSNVQVTTNGGGPGGTNYVYTMTINESTPGATIYYAIYACGEALVRGTTSPGQFVYRCTGHTGAATLYTYAVASGYNQSFTSEFNF